MAYYTPPQAMPPTIVPSRSNPQPANDVKPGTRPPQMQPNAQPPYIPPGVRALMQRSAPGGGYDNTGIPLSILHSTSGVAPGAAPAPGAQPVRPMQQFQNAGVAQSKPMQVQPGQMTVSQRQAALARQIGSRPGVSPAVAALMAQHPSQQRANDVTPQPRMPPNLMNRMRAFR